jgi:inward rectifier potassium channel
LVLTPVFFYLTLAALSNTKAVMVEQNDLIKIKEEERDLGFGTVVAQEGVRLLNRDGTFNVKRTGLRFLSSLNLYHWLLTISWKNFFGVVTLLYFALNTSFAIAFMLCGIDSLKDTSNEPIQNLFLRSFFFSVQTFATIGYGTIHPVGFPANFLVAIESLVGLLAQALVTGMLFARFSRPTAKIIFSRTVVVAPYRGITGLMFRITNARKNQLIELNCKLLFARFENGADGKPVRKFSFLDLERESVVFFPLHWTIVHPINEKSPLYGMTDEDLRRTDAEFLILLTAIDETFSQTVHSRMSYKHNEVRWNERFTNIFERSTDDSKLMIDVRRIDCTEPTE